MSTPGAMQALRELMLEEYKHGKVRGDRDINFFIHVADDVGAVGAEKLAQRYYEDGLGIEFGEVLYLLDESIQREWLERAYAEGNKTLYSEALECLYWDDRNNWMEMDPQVVEELAQQAYADDKVEIFDVLTWHMDRKTGPYTSPLSGSLCGGWRNRKQESSGLDLSRPDHCFYGTLTSCTKFSRKSFWMSSRRLLCPRHHMSFVTTASWVMSWTGMPPQSKIRCPVS